MRRDAASEHLLRDIAAHAESPNKGPNRSLDGGPVWKLAFSKYLGWLELVIRYAKRLAATPAFRAR